MQKISDCFPHRLLTSLYLPHPSGPGARQAAHWLAEGAGGGRRRCRQGWFIVYTFSVLLMLLLLRLHWCVSVCVCVLQFVLEEYTLPDVLNDVTKDDLRCLRLRYRSSRVWQKEASCCLSPAGCCRCCSFVTQKTPNTRKQSRRQRTLFDSSVSLLLSSGAESSAAYGEPSSGTGRGWGVPTD